MLKENVVCNSSNVIFESNGAILEDYRWKTIIHPSTINLEAIRCPMCNHLLGFADGRVQIKCNKCKYVHLADSRVAPTTDALI